MTDGKCKRMNIIDLKKQPEQFGRFVMALKNLEESDDWYRICGIHGNTFKPGDDGVLCPTDPKIVSVVSETGEPFYCKHSVYSFIAWHTPYVYQFELLLNKYNTSVDKSYIALPYIDLTDFTQDFTFMNTHVLHITFDGSSQTIENPLASAFFYKDGVKTKTKRNGYLTPSNMRQNLQLDTVRRQLNNVLHARSYERFSSHPLSYSKTNIVTDYIPLESPHNTLHDVIGGEGGNMSDISISAFDPIFWLHHCNMDRHYYTWLYNNTDKFTQSIHPGKISNAVYESSQAPFFKHGIYETDCLTYGYGWLNPKEKYAALKDVLELEKLPYTYDIIPLKLHQQTFAFVELLDIPIPRESMTIAVYLTPKNEQLNRDTNFAGSVFWFGVNRAERSCSRCEVTRTNMKIDIEDYVGLHKITQQNIEDYTLTIEGEGKSVFNQNGYSKYSQEEVLQDGSYKLVLL
jgi:hypothetical protein